MLLGVVLELHIMRLGMLLSILGHGSIVGFFQFIKMHLIVIGELLASLWVALAEVAGSFDGFAAQVAHFGAALASHVVAALLFVEAIIAFVADADHGLADFVFNIGTHAHFFVFLDLVATLRDVVEFFAQATRLLHALGVLAVEHFFALVLDYDRVGAEGTGLETVEACFANLVILDALEEIRGYAALQEAAYVACAVIALAFWLHANEVKLSLAHLCVNVCFHAFP